MRILIIQFSSTESILLSTPIIRILKTQLDAEVHYATSSSHSEILANNPYLTTIIKGASLFQLFRALRNERYDYIIHLQPGVVSWLLSLLLRGKVLSHKQRWMKKWLLVKLKVNLLPNQHIVEQYIDLLDPLEVKMDSLGLDFFIPDKDEVELEWLPETHQQGYAVVGLMTKHATQQLPVNRLIELCDRINKPIILLGDKNDVGVADEITAFFKPGTAEQEVAIESLNKKTTIFNACGKFNLHQMSSILDQANWVFTHDSDLMHIAAALKKPLFTIWGNTLPEFGSYPYRTQFTIFENKKIACRPCTTKGFANCPKGHFKCMNDLTFDFYLPD